MSSRLCVFVVTALSAFGQVRDPLGTPHVYKTVDGRELKLYVLSPPEARGPRPAVVFFHGGGWTGGLLSQFDEFAKHFAARGMVAIQVQYRLLKRGALEPPLVCVQDAKSAMRWVRSKAGNLGIDPNRIASGGGSAGGHLAAVVGIMDGVDDPSDDLSVPAKSNAMLLFNPVLDMGPGSVAEKRVGDKYLEYSPYHNIKRGMPPAIVFVGTQDKVVPVRSVEAFCEQARAKGGRCEARVYEGQPHGFFNYRNTGDNRYFKETLQAADEFLTSLGWLK